MMIVFPSPSAPDDWANTETILIECWWKLLERGLMFVIDSIEHDRNGWKEDTFGMKVEMTIRIGNWFSNQQLEWPWIVYLFQWLNSQGLNFCSNRILGSYLKKNFLRFISFTSRTSLNIWYFLKKRILSNHLLTSKRASFIPKRTQDGWLLF